MGQVIIETCIKPWERVYLNYNYIFLSITKYFCCLNLTKQWQQTEKNNNLGQNNKM